MKARFLYIALATAVCTGVATAETLKYDFNTFSDGPIDGQKEWNVYEKVRDSSPLSIMDELGTSEAKGDKALVIQASPQEIRCVTGEPVRWLPGMTLTIKFDFKVAAEPAELVNPKPSLTLFVGDSLVSPKSRFSIGLEALASGDWMLTGAMPDTAEKKVYSENFLFRSGDAVAISKWHRLELVVKKLSEPDAFESKVVILNAVSGEMVSEISFTSNNKDKVAQGVWNSARAHVGFNAPKDLLGLVCVDNLEITSTK